MTEPKADPEKIVETVETIVEIVTLRWIVVALAVGVIIGASIVFILPAFEHVDVNVDEPSDG